MSIAATHPKPQHKRPRRLTALGVHAWTYGLHDGLLSDLGFLAESESAVAPARDAAIARLDGGASSR